MVAQSALEPSRRKLTAAERVFVILNARLFAVTASILVLTFFISGFLQFRLIRPEGSLFSR
jgi:hypothetical protein